jgi:hypothetical protein
MSPDDEELWSAEQALRPVWSQGLTPEEALYKEITAGEGGAKIYNARYFLYTHLNIMRFLRRNHVSMRKWPAGRDEITLAEYARLLLEYYYLSAMLPRFEHDRSERPRVDMQLFLNLVVHNKEIVETIAAAQHELDNG